MEASLFDQEVSTDRPLSRKRKWIRGLFLASSCIPWVFLILTWDASYTETGFNVGLLICWLIIVPLSFLLGISAPILLRLEARSAGPRRFWWYATALACGPLAIGILLTARNGPSLF